VAVNALTSRESWAWGALGSVAPEVLRFYKLVQTGQSLPEFTIAYFIISLLFLVCAGFFVVAWEPENRYKALWVGVSFPIILSTMLQAAPALPGAK